MNLAKNFQENVTGIQHLGIPTADLNKTIEFYHSLGFSLPSQAFAFGIPKNIVVKSIGFRTKET